jgi:hypothetical protein
MLAGDIMFMPAWKYLLTEPCPDEGHDHEIPDDSFLEGQIRCAPPLEHSIHKSRKW